MKAGPKGEITAPPLDLSHLPPAGADRVVAFIEGYLVTPKGTGARQPVRLRPWQREIIAGLFDDPRPRQGLVSIPRGNGKSTLAAMLALYGLFADEVEGAQVLCVASDERQARIVFNAARRMVELAPELLEQCHLYRDKIHVPHTDSALYPLPAEAAALQGYDPSLAIVDELHVVTADVYESMELAAGKRDRSLLLAISTPAADTGSVMWRLVEHGRALDPADAARFYLKEYTAPAGCDLDDEDAWHVANPALGDFLHVDALRANRRTTRESSFRRFRLGQWVEQHDEAWIAAELWATCTDPRPVPDGARVVLGFDGSFNNDVTALIVASITEVPHLDVVRLWEQPGSPDWQVPILEVENAIREACRRWQVAEIACDPYRWARSLQVLEVEGLPVEAYPQSPQRMTPATTRFYEAVTNAGITHSGDRDLARHVGNAVLKADARGTRIYKEHKYSGRKIDAAVAALMAFDRASWHAQRAAPMIYVGGD